MKRTALLLAACVFLTAGGPAIAEPILAGPGGVLDTIYGLGNLTEIAGDADQLWYNPGTMSISAQGAWSSYRQRIGYLPGDSGGSFEHLFWVNATGYLDGSPSASVLAGDSGWTFRWADDPKGAPMWSSRDADNSDGKDHMRTFLITAGPAAGNYVIGWEDLPGLGDVDYQDVVLEVGGGGSPVPEPATLVLALLGLPLAAWRRRRA